ncbi:SIR2 family protein [Nocardioides zeae]|uniref:SIR2 family protein n=1 Tax=Nocardioides imazamoxiresistens TaxID=3231893 RepID=A0ABU3Q0K2_9ACTN|nr:SIR2 family protein [Nocardioides zeae]MDT9594889.1 SIR2 family protein [Nocardioides zeae]
MKNPNDPKKSIAVLIGNGASIAYSKNLLIPRITSEIVTRLDCAGNVDDPAAQLMQEIAQRLRVNNAAENFEALVGPFDEISDVTRMMDRLAGLAGDRALSIQDALRQSSAFALDLRRYAVSHILEVIARESTARYDDSRMNPLLKFVRATVDASGGGEVSYGNLNYDALLMAALCQEHDGLLCDMTDGRFTGQNIEVVPGYAMDGRRLRTVGNLPPNRRLSLIHLHGSLTWLHDTVSGEYRRFPIDSLRSSGYWEAWREGETTWEPIVVLTNQNTKTSLVEDYPFRLTYEVFYSRLVTADRWIIAGTSLQDACVNEMLQRAWRDRGTVPQVLVVTHGDGPTENEILNAVGWDPVWNSDPAPTKWLGVHRDGLESAPDSFEWLWWSLSEPVERPKAA